MSQTIACVLCETRYSSKASVKEGHLRGMHWKNTGESRKDSTPVGKCQGKRTLLLPSDTDNVREASGQKKEEGGMRGEQMRWDKLRWDYKVMSWAEMPFRNINCIKDLNMMTAWLNSHFKRPVWMLWRLLVKIVVKGGLVKRPAV